MHLKYLIAITLTALLPFSFVDAQSPTFTDQDCLACHGKPEISQIMHDGNLRTLYVDPEKWSQDIHFLGRLTCVDCHTNANPLLHFREGFIDVDCARCHPIEAEEYQKNIHQTFRTITPGKELPLCYHCHTKHDILRHDDPDSSVHESHIGETCGACHPEVMVKGILDGTSLGKISGHRKGDISEKFDMNVCTSCHYQDSAHGTKRVYKDFCTRCHDVRSKGNLVMGPTHLDASRWASLNFVGNGLLFLLFLISGTLLLFRSRKRIVSRISSWQENMKIPVVPEESTPQATETAEKQENHESE
ncbi:MAG: hypothetical protein JSV17_06470 [Candidatus Aminicenantes bacterium]|nr:MAG: hypothetical protein JSV17_06470 [Candidatus Aminicenantes bacterium]